ncbi:MAG: hypothetical protein KGH61_01480 [Candidatus Micrarchaeota archaeon]|nr:hypothetical protein [Candidatus Micrarchaeota archaeon]MDE1847602.1 hypothetical protein [Candidatus Micrarchaeota archaeon]MDE1863805.1 hypothetical protein [Candidatus Micrarchaeota archaeon]
MKMFKLQSAMEYLMTYGWAILIIAIVLGALFGLGILNGNAFLITSCLPQPGFLCQTPTLNTQGNLSFSLGQSTGSTVYNIAVGCATGATSIGLPSNGLVYMYSNGLATPWLANVANAGLASGNALSLTSGSQQTLSGIKCFTANPVNALTGPSIGTAYSGTVWVNYTLSNGAVSTSNPFVTQKMATVSLKVS